MDNPPPLPPEEPNLEELVPSSPPPVSEPLPKYGIDDALGRLEELAQMSDEDLLKRYKSCFDFEQAFLSASRGKLIADEDDEDEGEIKSEGQSISVEEATAKIKARKKEKEKQKLNKKQQEEERLKKMLLDDAELLK